MKTEPSPEFTPVPGFPNHYLTPDSFIFSMRAGRKLSRRWTKKGWTTRITDENKEIRIIYHDSPPTSRPVDPRTLIDQLELARIPGYSKYWASPEGSVFRIDRGKAVRVSDHLRGFQAYVNVVSDDGLRKCKNVDYLAELAHGFRPGRSAPGRNAPGRNAPEPDTNSEPDSELEIKKENV